MQYINSELGIRVKQDFADMKYLNSTGGRNRKRAIIAGALAVVAPPVAVAYLALSPSEKKRYNEVMGSASNPQSSKIAHYEKDIIKPKYPFSANMSSEALEAIITELTKEYQRQDADRDSKASAVAKSSKSMKVSPNREIIAQLQDVRAMMQALNDYRADVIKAYDKALAREEKEAEKPAPTPTPTGSPLGAPAPTSSLAPSIDGGNAGSLAPSMGGGLQGEVKLGKTQVKKSYLLFGGLTLGVLGFLFLRKK